MVYLDCSAASPLDPRAAEAMAEARAAAGGNPSSVHAAGRRARAVLNEARAKAARLIGAAPSEVVFTASGSEANNLAMKGAAFRAMAAARASGGAPAHLVISEFEHDCVRNAARWLAAQFPAVRLSEVAPDASGLLDPEAFARACAGGAALVSAMLVNNEVGTRQPIEEIAAIARAAGALFHTDAVQAPGRVPFDVRALGCDLLSLSAHKFGGPRGIGLLYIRDGVKLEPLIHGGHQEKGRRAGTEWVEGAAGLARALEIAVQELAEERAHLARLEAAFLAPLRARTIEFATNGEGPARAPGILNVSIRGAASHDLVVGMDLAGFCISAGAACSSGVIEPSHVLAAMRLPAWRIESGVRISFGRANTPEEAAAAGEALAGLALRLAAESAALARPLPARQPEPLA